MRFLQKLNEILVRIEKLKIYTNPPFSVTEHQIEKHIDKKRTHGETFNKQYNHEVS